MSNNELEIILKMRDLATAKIRKAVGLLETQTKKVTRSIARLGSQIKAHWIAISIAMAAVVMVGKKVIGTAIEFESAFAGVRKTVDATEKEFQMLSNGIRELSKTIPVAAKDLAGIQEIAGQLGVRGVANLTKFTKTVAEIAVTTNLTKEVAATAFARISNIMQEPLENIDRMGAAIVDLGNNFATTEDEIATFALRIAGASNVVGLSTADIFGFGAAFSSVGVRAERGGTAVSKSLIMMSTAVAEGGMQLKKFADISGVTTEAFKKGFEEDAAGAFALFIEGLGKSGREGAKILEQLELGDQRLIQAFLSVGGATGILTKAIDQANRAYQENTALNIEAAKRFGTTASQIQIFKNTVDDLLISLGTNLFPAIGRVIEVMTVLVKRTSAVALAFELVRAGGSKIWEGLLAGAKAVVWTLWKVVDAMSKIPKVGAAFKEVAAELKLNVEQMENLRLSAEQTKDAQLEAGLKHLENLTAEGSALDEIMLKEQQRADAAGLGADIPGGGGGEEDGQSESLEQFFGLEDAKIEKLLEATDIGKQIVQAGIYAQLDAKRAQVLAEGKMDDNRVKKLKAIDQAKNKIMQESTGKQMTMIAGQAQGTLSALAGFLQQAQGESEKYKGAIKGIRIAEAIMGTAAAVTNALNTQPFFPVGIAMGALAAATGAIQIATIAAAAEGGVITKGGKTLVGEQGPEIVDFPGGARITPLTTGGAGGVTNINVEINNPSIRSDDDIDDLVEAVSLQLAYETDRIR